MAGEWSLAAQLPAIGGSSMVLSGDTLLESIESGAVVYALDNGIWTQQAFLNPTDSPKELVIALDGDTAVLGLPRAGAANIFARSGSQWSLQARLTSANPSENAWFGGAVALQGNTAVVGATREDSPAGVVDAGAVYVFERNGASWNQASVIRAPGARTSLRLGSALALDGDTLVADSEPGLPYAFVRSGTDWTQQWAFGDVAGPALQSTIALRGDVVAFGKPCGVRIARRSGTTWSEPEVVVRPDPWVGCGDSWPRQVSISGDTLLYGFARPNLSGGVEATGRGYLFDTRACPGPAFTIQPTDISVCAGESPSFSVATDALLPSYQWYREYDPLTDDAQYIGTGTDTLTIPSAPVSINGHFYCVVTDEATGCASYSNNIVIDPRSVAITEQPQPVVGCRGGNAILTVGWAGTAASVEWRRGTQVLPKNNKYYATSTSLTIHDLVPADAGDDYYCVIAAIGDVSHCSVVSDSTTLTVLECVTQQPQSQTVCEGDTASFTVASDLPNPTYQWRRRFSDLEDGANLIGTHSSTLTILHVTGDDIDDEYNCEITDASGTPLSDSDDASLSLQGSLPHILTQPAPQSIPVGGSTVFAVTTVEPMALLEYQWRRNGVALADGGTFLNTRATPLIVLNATAADFGVIDVVITNFEGGCTVSSAPALLRVGDNCPGDIDQDGDVDLSDLGVVLAAYGLSADGDTDGDGNTDLSDLGVVLAAFGNACP